ncbi:hypothetical protein SAMN05216436_12087 [bacterium A37T11]|nr:hypothetical protein SAMN05216436_12087 [bacterium A37T11]
MSPHTWSVNLEFRIMLNQQLSHSTIFSPALGFDTLKLPIYDR